MADDRIFESARLAECTRKINSDLGRIMNKPSVTGVTITCCGSMTTTIGECGRPDVFR